MASKPPLASDASNATLIRRLLALSWRYRRGCIQVLLLQTVILASGLVGLGFTGLAVDVMHHAIDPAAPAPKWSLHFAPPTGWTPIRQIEAIALTVLIVSALRGLLDAWYRVAMNQLVQGEIVVHMRAEIYDKMQRMSFRFFDANASGSLINRVTGDVQSVRMFVDQVLIQSVILFLSLGTYLVYMLSIHVRLTVVCLATTPLMGLLSMKFSRDVQPAFRNNRDLVDAMIQRLSENIRGISVVKAFAREDDEIEKFRRVNETVREQKNWIFKKIAIFNATIGLFSQANLIVLLGYGGYLAMKGQISVGAGLMVFAGILQQFADQISNISVIANSMQESLTGASRVFEVLDASLEIEDPVKPVPLPQARGHLKFNNVWFDHGEDPVLREIDFEVKAGQRVAIFGGTGAGKSALLSLIPRFYDPTKGRILLDSIDLRDLSLDDLRGNVGLVFQESFLFSTTIAANIAFGHPQASREQVEKAARIAAAHEFIMEMPKGYDTVLGEGGVGLSGGQRQRLAIARAVLLEPAILVLDDPTAAIDQGTEREIVEAMDSAMASRTTFIVTHRLSMLRRADFIIVLDDGVIVQSGSHYELLKQQGYYMRAVALQLEHEISQHEQEARRKPAQIGLLPPRDKEERDVEIKPLQFFKLMRRLFGYTKPYARTRNVLIGCVLLRSIQLPLIGKAIAWVINGAITRHDLHSLMLSVVAFTALIISTQLNFYYRVKLALGMSESVIRDIRNEMFQLLQRLTISFFNKMKVGRIISRMNSDLEAIRMGVQDVVFISLVQAGQMFFSAIFMFFADRVLFAVMMVMAPVIWLLNSAFRGRLSSAQREAQESFSRITATIAESVGGVRVTQGFVREEVNAGLFRDLVQDHSRYNMSVAKTSAMFLPLLEFNNQFFIALLILLGGYRVLNPAIATPIGSIIQFFFLANLFFEPIKNLGNQYTQALMAVVGAERVFRLLDTKPEWTDPPDAVELKELQGRVEFRGLSFGYEPPRMILHDINFIAEPGKTVALVGHTGSGKSSIINLISKFYLPSGGGLLIDGRDIRNIDSHSLHRHLGVVHQQNFLFEGTVIDNIRFPRPEATDEEVFEAARKLDYLDLIELMPHGFQTAVGEGGSGLSLGQRQLVCFTRALLADPRILILDEATSSIDALTEARIQNSLVTLLQGRTSFVVAHRLSTIRQADVILVMEHGRIVERGTHDELLQKHGVYHALYFQHIRSGVIED